MACAMNELKRNVNNSMTFVYTQHIKMSSFIYSNPMRNTKKRDVFDEVPLAVSLSWSQIASDGPMDARIVNLRPFSARCPPKVGADSVVVCH